jgi:DNA recombination protein RmuC
MEAAMDFYARVNVFADHIVKMGGGLKSALKSYNDAIGSWDGRVLPAGRKLEELRSTEARDALPEIGKIETPLRELKKPEN